MDAPRRPPPSSSRSSIRKTRALHPCPQCGKTFTKRSNMLIHARLHTGETPYVCKFAGCGRSYKWLSSINFHEGRCDRRHMGLAVPAPRPPPPPAAAEAARIAQQQQRQAHANAQQSLPPPLPGYHSLHMTATGRSPSPPPPPPPPPLRPPPQFAPHHQTHHHYPQGPSPPLQQQQHQQQQQQQFQHSHQQQQGQPQQQQQHQQHLFAAAGPSMPGQSYTHALSHQPTFASPDPLPPSAYSQPPYSTQYTQALPPAPALDPHLQPHHQPPHLFPAQPAQQPPNSGDPGFHTPRKGKRFRAESPSAPIFSPLTPSPISSGPGTALSLAFSPPPSFAPNLQNIKTVGGRTKRISTDKADHTARRFLGVAAVKRGREAARRPHSPVGRGGTELHGSPESACSKEVRDMLAPYAPVMLLSGTGVAGEEDSQRGGAGNTAAQGPDLENIGESFGLSDEDLFMANCSLVGSVFDELAINALDGCTAESAESISLFP